ncbi:SCO family protein [Brevundimonas sp. Root1279]|uniref:SCO family protein n=1 Tax=Brevundimonas sp. Root1279 TaxID=1736443 RepID=UPI00070032C9|nr:SCO family protein [Brevundimonas sp. Root1279]KQW81932.1 hypothetical protein ASC65_11660 [Brevundimonas sp. Root1279]
MIAAVLLAAVAVVVGGMLLGSDRSAAPAPGQAKAEAAGTLRAGAFDPPKAAPDFVLRGSNGGDLTLSRYRGKVVLMTFGFTYCAAVCPTTLATLSEARESLGEDADSVQIVFITVDPARDDPAHLQGYLSTFGTGLVGATGSEEELAKVRELYGVSAARQGDGPDYAMAHTSSIFLIDPAGRLRGMMPFGHDADDFAHDIRLLLKA